MTTDTPICVLLIEDNPGDRRLIEEILNDARRIKTNLTSADSLQKGLAFLSEKKIDILLLDLSLSDSNGLATLDKVTQAFPELPVVIMTGLNDTEMAIHAMSAGAQDYIVKGSVESESLERVIRYAIERNQIKQRLLESEARFRKLIEKNADGIVIVDKEGNIRFTNPSTEKIFCRNSDELLDLPFGFPVLPDEITEMDIVRKDKISIVVEVRAVEIEWEGSDAFLISLRDVTVRKNLEIEREKIITRLKKAVAEIKTLSGLLPICSYCKKIKDDKGYWSQIETYIQNHSDTQFSHGICKECAEEHFPDLNIYEK